MKRLSIGTAVLVAGAFLAGLFSHLLYQRWSAPGLEGQGYSVSFSPLPPPAPRPAEIPLLEAREVEKIRALNGNQARIRGRVYRVGHSAKSNTYFLNFGPSRAAFTAVIFASALESFEKQKIRPATFEGKEVELTGEIKDHPKYGVEMILEDPAQIKVLD
ncbi:MAG: hypothetical protein AABZ59_02150 [Candidatus Binatota bacterium]